MTRFWAYPRLALAKNALPLRRRPNLRAWIEQTRPFASPRRLLLGRDFPILVFNLTTPYVRISNQPDFYAHHD
jgi:hypothetical protein